MTQGQLTDKIKVKGKRTITPKEGDQSPIHTDGNVPPQLWQKLFPAGKRMLISYGMYAVLLLLIVMISMREPSFLSASSLKNIMLNSSTRLIMALGIAFVLVTGGVDLSVGRVVGLAAVLSASMLQVADYSRKFYPHLDSLPLILPILVAVLAGCGVGIINGSLVAKLKIPPFIATLGTMVIVYGINLVYFDQDPNNSQPIGGLRSDFTLLGSGSVISIPYLTIMAVVATIIIWFVFNKTVFGKNLYALGGNRDAARVAGINVDRTLLYAYMIAAAMAAMAGVLEAARSGGAKSNYGEMYELDAIAACVVGGVSTTGGVGTIPGVVAGVLIFAVINYGLSFIGMDPNLQYIAKGLIITIAVGLDVQKNRSRN